MVNVDSLSRWGVSLAMFGFIISSLIFPSYFFSTQIEVIESIKVLENQAELLLEIYDNFLTFGFIPESEKALERFLEAVKGINNQEQKLRLYETLLTILLENNLVKKMKEISTSSGRFFISNFEGFKITF